MTVERRAVHVHGQAGGSCWQERTKGTVQVLGESVVGGFPVILLQQALSLLLLLPVLCLCKPTRQPAACFWFTSGSTSTWACSNLPRKHTRFPTIKDFPEVTSVQQNSRIKEGRNQAAEVWSCHNAKNPTTHQEFMPAGFPAGWPKFPSLSLCAGHIMRDELLMPLLSPCPALCFPALCFAAAQCLSPHIHPHFTFLLCPFWFPPVLWHCFGILALDIPSAFLEIQPVPSSYPGLLQSHPTCMRGGKQGFTLLPAVKKTHDINSRAC